MNDSYKKIAIIGVKGFPAFGGASRSMEQIIDRLKDDFKITVYAVDSHMSKEYKNDDVKFVVFKGNKSKRFNTLMYYIKSGLHALIYGNYDVIHLQHLYSGFLAPFLRLKFMVVTTMRGLIPPNDNKWNFVDKRFFKIFEHISVRFSNVIVTVSRPHISYLKRITEKEILYIPNGVSIQKDIKKDNVGEYIVFAAGRIISLKGCHVLLDALNKIKYSGKLLVIGSLDHVSLYGEKLKQSALSLDVDFLGLIKDKSVLMKYIRDAKMFVFPSFNEGMSNMLLEVASQKTPLVCSDIVENRAVFNSDEVLFFKTGDSNDLADKIKLAESNYKDMVEKSRKAYDKCVLEYNWESVAEKYSSLYNSL